MIESLPLTWSSAIGIALTIGGYVLAFALIPRILFSRREAGATLAWILVIAFLPYLGALLFFLVGRTRVRRRARKRRRARETFVKALEHLPLGSPECRVRQPLPELPSPADEITRVATSVTCSPALEGNTLEVYVDTNRAYRKMEEAIEAAGHHVHMMSYIFRPDAAGTRFRDLLARKAREGVEVRLLVDAVGSHRLSHGFVAPLVSAGGRFARFMPVFPFGPRWRPNLRNHRKILVADGRVGFAGGLNIGDEYQGRKKRYAPWRDTHLRIEGPAALRLEEVFTEDWFFATDEDLADAEHFPDPVPRGGDLVQVVESGPDLDQETIHAVFFTAISRARERVWITTPYFVPDRAVLLALKTAAWRGVDVRILLPRRSDLKLVQTAGRSFYRELLETGVRIHELRTGMLHAKTLVVDGVWSTVGSANLDIRSFRLNFEVNVLVTGREFARQLETIFEHDLTRSRPITADLLEARTPVQRLAEAVSRILSPVL